MRRRQGIEIACIAAGLLLAGPLTAEAGKRKASKPIQCSGTKDLVVKDKIIKAADTGVRVSGSCDLHLINCKIVAGKFGMRISSNGDIHIKRSYVEGKRAAILLSGNGDVHASNSTFVGKIKITGNADFHKKGGNKFRKK